MNLCIGTTSSQKTSYIVKQFAKEFLDLNVTNYEVESGVSDQPMGRLETKTGAKNRAKNAFSLAQPTPSPKIGIGLEAGFVGEGQDLYMICFACVYDGQNYFQSSSNPLIIPREVSKKIKEGSQFGEEIRIYEKHKQNDYPQSHITELIDREQSFSYALEKVLIKFQLNSTLAN